MSYNLCAMSVVSQISYLGNSAIAANKIASKYNLELVERPEKFDNLLILSDEKLSLKLEDFNNEFYVDFFNNYFRHRVSKGKKEALLTACGVKSGVYPSVLDLTGGWGRDGYILASSGCEVLVLERNPIVYLLLNDGIRRLKQKVECNIKVINIESGEYLKNNNINSQVIYFDPMRPIENKKSKNKKEIEILRKIITNHNNEKINIPELAYKKTSNRLVIKSGAYQDLYPDLVPTFSIKGKNTKFDVYCK